MKFLGQCFERLKREQDRQTDATERITSRIRGEDGSEVGGNEVWREKE